MASCQSPPTPLVTETDGSYVRLPDDSTKAIVWGSNSEAVKSLKTWLLKRRVTVVDEAKVSQIAVESGVHHALTSADVLKSAKTAGARQVVFVDADVSASQSFDLFGQPFGQPRYNASLDIRALDVDSGEIAWNGKARSTQTFRNLAEG
ncbi:MAG TPA: hypothetical protein VFP47_20835, partial [Pyrinomonadaceae bacterium]|nr:hypothetical protein [Pyrinomonadaceae bacterium]